MLFFKDKEGLPLALVEIRDSAAAGLTEITKEEYLALIPEEAEDVIDEVVEGKIPVEVQFLADQGGVAKALYAVALKLGMVGGELPPADGVIVSDNFQDGNGKAPFNLQVRNTTGEAVEFVAVVSGVGYGEIPDLKEGDYSHEVSKGNEAYVHTFTGKLDAYQSITITGGVPSPAGTGKGLELFIKEGS